VGRLPDRLQPRPNTDAQGNPRIYLNDSDLNALSDKLSNALGDDLANYIIAYRIYGGTSTSGNGAGGAPGGGGTTTVTTVTYTKLSDADDQVVKTTVQTARATPSTQPQGKLSSVLDLLNSSVNVPSGTGPQARVITLQSPLDDPNQVKTLLPLVFDMTTTTTDPDLMPRINVNTASQTVLSMIPGLQDTDVQQILNNRPDPSNQSQSSDPEYQTPTWLLTEANLSPTTLKSIEKYITARTQVYHFQVIGYFDVGGGITSRVEAVIDGNNGRPRIVYWRDLSELGRGFDLTAGE
jgi:DNA uptake protein ComE-like DNA-binding protein